MKNFIARNKIPLALFGLIFCILAVFASKTFLFYDDVMYGFPAVTKKYLDFYNFYIRDWGLFRPLALVYYFFIYQIFFLAPFLAHLIPLVILITASFLLFKILIYQGLNKEWALISGLLLATVPFTIEAISWLSANISIIVILIFFLQIYLIESKYLSKYLLEGILILQLAAIFFYETTIFIPLAISYLLYRKLRVKNILIHSSFTALPLFVYFISKIAIKPLFEHKDKVIGIAEFIKNWSSSLYHIRVMLSGRYLYNFWGQEVINGFNLLNESVIAIILFFGFLLIFSSKLFANKEIKLGNPANLKTGMNFWGLSFMVSLIPLSWQPTYQPFRTLILPFITLLVFLFFCITYWSNNKYHVITNSAVKTLSMILIPLFIMIQISMLDKYHVQYNFDKKITLEIDEKLEKLGFEHPYRSNLFLKNFPYNRFNQLRYGDYMYGMYHYYWSAEALLDLNSGSFNRVAIEVPGDKYFTAKFMTKDEFLKLRPLTIMSFTDTESCINGECLKVEEVLH